jgi:hypothetical protein
MFSLATIFDYYHLDYCFLSWGSDVSSTPFENKFKVNADSGKFLIHDYG